MRTTPRGAVHTNSQHRDWFARITALIALALTTIGLYYTYRNYEWQTKESLKEELLLRAGFNYTSEKRTGTVRVDVVNVGLHPVYVDSVEIEVPCTFMTEFPQRPRETCGILLYDLNPTHSNKPMEPLEPGDDASYTTDSWNFSRYPLQDWVKSGELQDKLWIDVDTTKERFRQHPFNSWYHILTSKGAETYLP